MVEEREVLHLMKEKKTLFQLIMQGKAEGKRGPCRVIWDNG